MKSWKIGVVTTAFVLAATLVPAALAQQPGAQPLYD
jgi:hypothetical protein